MCGIVGYVGESQAAPILLEGLEKLEYRGYDSAGIAVYDGKKINMKKAMGRLKVLNELTHGGELLPGKLGIGHTRWATHGAPSDINAHPHFNKDQSIVVVHNGIIENYLKLKHRLESKGYETQLLEFIDMEHTPKNILIRAVKTGKKKSRDSFSDTMKALHVAPTLDRLLYPEESASQKGE